MLVPWKLRYVSISHWDLVLFWLISHFKSRVYLQEGVAIEIAEAVIGALNGELAATAVNAPMVPAEVQNLIKSLKAIIILVAL